MPPQTTTFLSPLLPVHSLPLPPTGAWEVNHSKSSSNSTESSQLPPYVRPAALAVGPLLASQCSEIVCKLPDCLCPGLTSAPRGLVFYKVPQIIMLTFGEGEGGGL